MIKMLVTDLDGTLLRGDKTISDYTASVFRRCQSRNIKLAIATARPIRAVNMLDIPLLFDALIYHNGAVIDRGDGDIVHFGIAPPTTRHIVNAVFQSDPQARLCIEINDQIYGNTDVSDIWPGIKINRTDFSDLPSMPADKVLLLTADRHRLDPIQRALPDDLYLEISEDTVGMIMHKNANKARAVALLCEYLGIPLGAVAAFGDDYNDIEMLRCAGIGVAVANAIDAAKDAADFICGAHDSDGVARWVDRHVLRYESSRIAPPIGGGNHKAARL